MQSMKRQPLINFYHRTFCASCTNAVFRTSSRGGSRTAASSKMKRFVIIVFGWMEEAVSYYHKALHLGCCSSPRSASVSDVFWGYRKR